MAINQKGANGLIAEYQCAVTLNSELIEAGFHCVTNQSHLESNLQSTIARVGNELTESQVERALKQGIAAGEYIFQNLTQKIDNLGITGFRVNSTQDTILVKTIGNETNSGNPTDLLIEIDSKDAHIEIPISLKAYRGPESSLGSKSSRASLARMFMNSESVTDSAFIEFFDSDGRLFLDEIAKFKSRAKEFYDSDLGEKFVNRYEQRKGTRRVNNPLRRKEVGDYFHAVEGYKSEHRFAELYVRLFNYGLEKFHRSTADSSTYIDALRFILGHPEMLVIDVIANDSGKVEEIHNSLNHPVYLAFNQVLKTGVELNLHFKPKSSIIKVELTNNGNSFNNLSLAMWKDSTIQYKLNVARSK